jgi:hypothetical protein
LDQGALECGGRVLSFFPSDPRVWDICKSYAIAEGVIIDEAARVAENMMWPVMEKYITLNWKILEPIFQSLTYFQFTLLHLFGSSQLAHHVTELRGHCSRRLEASCFCADHGI